MLCSPGPGGRRRYIGDVEGSIPLPSTPRGGAVSRARPGACRGRAPRASAQSPSAAAALARAARAAAGAQGRVLVVRIDRAPFVVVVLVVTK